MKRLALALMTTPALAVAGAEPFEGYEAYYATLPDTLFKAESAVTLEAHGSPSGDTVRLSGRGGASGNGTHSIEVGNGNLIVDRQAARIKAARVFPGETVSTGDLGRGTVAYFATGWACVENTPSSASGTAVRHKAVYLLRTGGLDPLAWKLPSLFASCTSIRRTKDQIRFDKAAYRYNPGQDFPAGVLFKEYLISSKNDFAPTGNSRSVSFVEPENVYRFSADER